MATGFRARFDAAADPGFQKLVAQALAETAVAIYNETPQPANHPARSAYAVLVITDPPLSMVSINSQGIGEPDKRVFAVARLLTTQGIDGTSTDAAISAGVASVWNALANA